MSDHDHMQDEFYATIMFQIEAPLYLADKDLAEEDITLTDSQVNSVINQALSFYTGKKPKQHKAESERDRLLRQAYAAITAIPKVLEARDAVTKEPIPPRDLNGHIRIALKAVRSSIKKRRSLESGSRLYLDYLRDFMADATEEEKVEENSG